jgi:hypothetical protein
MKTILTTIITALLLLLSNSVIAGQLSYQNMEETEMADNDELYKEYEKSLLYGLESENATVVESVLFNALQIKTEYPDFTSAEVKDKLAETVKNGQTHVVRYKAYLTLYYYKNQQEFGSPGGIAMLFETRNANGVYHFLDDFLRDGQLTAR